MLLEPWSSGIGAEVRWSIHIIVTHRLIFRLVHVYMGITSVRRTPLFSVIARMSQVTWPQHGHILCTHNTHLFGELGHAPAMKIF